MQKQEIKNKKTMSTLNNNVILIVDDTFSNLEVLSETLSEAGFEVAVATSGENTLKQLEYDFPDMILLDVMMPGIDGFETCRRIKENPLTHNIPIIFMTALAESVDKVKGLNLGAVDYITKPFHQEEVLARIRTHLKLRKLTETLERQNFQLKELTEELEQRVAERTTKLLRSLQDLKQAQLQLVQSEKMSALGQLIAGVAHEVNNPINFIAGNVQPIQDYIRDLLKLVDLYQHKFPDPGAEIEEEIEAIDLDYLRQDIPKLINSVKLGVERIGNISTSLRTFSRADKDCKVLFDIHQGIDSTLLILNHRLKANEYRPAIQIAKEYGELPLIECFPGQLNQVFMNLLANAIDALEESNKGLSVEDIKAHPNKIVIHTEVLEGNRVKISISDNGIGITEETKQYIFEYLFTTKPVGQGTGLGLSIARQIVVEKHNGTLDVYSQLGQGSTFVLTLPLSAEVGLTT
jgi:signal transduction histidine kinase